MWAAYRNLTHTQGEEMMKKEQLDELLYQALETELGGVQVYTAAIECAVNSELKEEWEKYLDQTRTHVRIVQDVMSELDLDPETETPGRFSHECVSGPDTF